MRLDKTRRLEGQAIHFRARVCCYLRSPQWTFQDSARHALKTAHTTAMLALTGGLFIISTSENSRD